MKRYLYLAAGTFLMAAAYKSIYQSVGMVTGGFSGIGVIVNRVTGGVWAGGVPLWITNVTLNVPLFIAAFYIEGKEFIKDILDHNRDCIVIIDEAYVDFGGYSCVELLKEYDNLLIVQTFSKSRSLAGMRIGVAIGSAELIGVLNAIKNCYNSYTMDSVAIACGKAAVEDDEYFRETLKKVISTRDRSAEEFKKLGFTVYPSHSNFIFVTKDDVNAKDLFEALKKDNIFIRYFNLPRINNHLRITIGTDEQMDILIEHVKKYLEK